MPENETPQVTPSGAHQAMVETAPHNNQLSTYGPPSAFPGPMGPSPHDVIRGGIDASSLMNSLRRRWMLVLGMSLLLGAATATGLFLVLPESSSATAVYMVESKPVSLLDEKSQQSSKDFGIFKNTQLAWIKSQAVLTTALRDREINSLPMFRDQTDPVAWLSEELQVSFPNNGELLQITLEGSERPEDLKKVVEAVSRAYTQDVLFNERNIRKRPIQILKTNITKLDNQVSEKMKVYYSLAKDTGSSAAYDGGVDPQTRLLMHSVTELQKREAVLKSKLVDAAMKYRMIDEQIKDPSYLESRIDQALAGDPTVSQMQNEMMMYDAQIRMLQTTVKGGSSPDIRRLDRLRQNLSSQIAQYRQQMRAQLAGQNETEPDPYLKAAVTEFSVTRAMLDNELKQVQTEIQTIQEKLLDKAERNTDLMVRQAEIEQLKEVQRGIASKIQNLQVEMDAPERIRPIGADSTGAALAEIREHRNTLQRYLLSALGGLTVFGLTGFGIGYMEFLNRRLNGPDQVDEGLGIRVIGTLPSLAGRKALNPNHPVVAQLTESIDSVRTALMHESTSKRRRLVLVTSAGATEGRTTVASQLAASLARAGRRTLLIDGDMRRPALHTLFSTPLEDGLCEVLRGEAELKDAVRATAAEGLWLLPAGYCDPQAVQALAGDAAQALFQKMREDYDFVIIDGAPVLDMSDSLLFGQHCDGAILSVLRDVSSTPKIHKTAELLKSVGVRLIGSVVNGVPIKTDRRVTQLQKVTPKNGQRKLETADA
ncbi:Tyrosine-protein kinase YwqD [Pseudobythopirellula maris]|uniref:Tyrosine-protein kinase YwqD n=1 Tax=Pseudobythopirellula maris TaxID=2527991 RepID=A0A5C5ZPK4_9BACT|nr:polysaccharide biosynthesis tyrosine autokinase [Pseudobythopirellula maris]TWT88711.1 Tyrosine-protein kinase YwqD [Pseudobythopirellula maris]